MKINENPFKKKNLTDFSENYLSSPARDDPNTMLTPPYPITYNHITRDNGAPKTGVKMADARNINCYQVVPGIVYLLLEKVTNKNLKEVMTDSKARRTVDFIARYGYATRKLPFVTMHAACSEYGIKPQPYMNQCKGDEEAIPVAILLVTMYNACLAFQHERHTNLLILALERFDLGTQISTSSFVRTFSE